MDKLIKIRTLKESDLNDLIALYKHLHPNDFPLPTTSELEKIWQTIINNPCIHYFAAEFDHKPVSSCALAIIPNLTRGARPYGLIENVVTHSDFRRKGFSKAVLEHALNFAWRSNCYKVMLMSNMDRFEAHRLYESVGFNRDEKVGYVARPV